MPTADGHSYLNVRIESYSTRTGDGAVVREDTRERIRFRSFFADRGFTPLTPGERVWCELSPNGDVVNLTRLH